MFQLIHPCLIVPFFCNRADKLQVKGSSIISSNEISFNRRLAIFCSGASLVSSITVNCNLTALPAKAEEKNPEDKEAEGDAGVIGAIKSLLDPNDKTKSGKVLPKAYLKAAREVVKTLRESLEENTKDVAKFRRSADSAKESIREYLSGWRGQQAVVAEVHVLLTLILFFHNWIGRCHITDGSYPSSLRVCSYAMHFKFKLQK